MSSSRHCHFSLNSRTDTTLGKNAVEVLDGTDGVDPLTCSDDAQPWRTGVNTASDEWEGVMSGKADQLFDPEAFLSGAGNGTTQSIYSQDKIIFSQGEAADSIFYVNNGKVKLTVHSEQGKEAVVAILGPGDFLGEGCLAGQPRRMATSVAITECLITRVDKAAAIRLLHDTPEFSERFVSHLLTRNIRVEADLVDQ